MQTASETIVNRRTLTAPAGENRAPWRCGVALVLPYNDRIVSFIDTQGFTHFIDGGIDRWEDVFGAPTAETARQALKREAKEEAGLLLPAKGAIKISAAQPLRTKRKFPDGDEPGVKYSGKFQCWFSGNVSKITDAMFDFTANPDAKARFTDYARLKPKQFLRRVKPAEQGICAAALKHFGLV